MVSTKTNYNGYVYFGEYAHCFAACLGQAECYRLILSKGVNADDVDVNGNNILHILVIKEKIVYCIVPDSIFVPYNFTTFFNKIFFYILGHV